MTGDETADTPDGPPPEHGDEEEAALLRREKEALALSPEEVSLLRALNEIGEQTVKREEGGSAASVTMVVPPAPPAVPAERPLWEIVEVGDEEILAREFEGKVLENYVYTTMDKGKKIEGLTLTGVRHFARRLNIRVKLMQFIDAGDRYVALTVAEQKDTGLTWPGAAEEMKRVPFAAAKAVSKSARNAARGLMDEKMVLAAIDSWKEERTAKRQGR